MLALLSIPRKVITYVLLLVCVTAFHGTLHHPARLGKHAEAYRDVHLAAVRIGLTRELGANDKLSKLLEGLECFELPTIQFAPGADLDKLSSAVDACDLITISSPQAAKVLLQELYGRDLSSLKVATVGKGTSKVLIKEGILPVFEPQKEATAAAFADELPTSHGLRILYPTSALAENTLQNGLESRGFSVTRLNTYMTEPRDFSEEDIRLAKSMDIVTLASPSAARIWAEKMGTDFVAVTIGPTSHKAAEGLGYKIVRSPAVGSKGVEAWADTVKAVAAELETNMKSANTHA